MESYRGAGQPGPLTSQKSAPLGCGVGSQCAQLCEGVLGISQGLIREYRTVV